jgi:chromosome segregation ATPase
MLKYYVKKHPNSDELRLRALENAYLKKNFNPQKIKSILNDNEELKKQIAQLKKQKSILSNKIKQLKKQLRNFELQISDKNRTIDTLILLGDTKENYLYDIRRLKKIHAKLEKEILHLKGHL